MPSPIIGKARRRSPSRPPLRPPALRRRRCPPPRPAGAGDRSPSERTTVLSVVAWLHHEWLDESPYGYIQKWLDRRGVRLRRRFARFTVGSVVSVAGATDVKPLQARTTSHRSDTIALATQTEEVTR